MAHLAREPKMLRISFYLLLTFSILATTTTAGLVWWLVPQLPDTKGLRDVQLQTPLTVYTADGSLIAEFGEKRRKPVTIEEVPLTVRQAFLAAEDDRFYAHPGVDWIAIVRAGVDLLQSHKKRQGGSTITMQVARNFYLSREKTFARKLREIMLAIKIEQELSKNEILELYLNKIFLGHRAYGIGAAAQVYYGATLEQLTLAETAMIAALPKAPSIINPIFNPTAALRRRAYVLRRMLELGFIDQTRFDNALAAPQTARLHGQQTQTNAPYLAEMVRSSMLTMYGDAAYTGGYRVYTTLHSELQAAAVVALRKALLDYDRRHGYRGPEAHVDWRAGNETQAPELLLPYPPIGGLEAALVVALEERGLRALTAAGEHITLGWDGLAWARPYLTEDSRGPAPKRADDILKVGDVIRLAWAPASEPAKPGDPPAQWRLAQIPVVEGALVSLSSNDGAVLCLVGGFDFEKSKFNRVAQALRQPGSNFKPFIYSTALDHGFTPASFINDAPIVFDAPGLETAWRPENYSGTYSGPTRLREALANSRNLVSIRLMRELGVAKVITHASHFGFDPKALPHNLSLSLGTGEVTPLALATGYAAFSNGGFLVTPYFIQRVETSDGKIVQTADPLRACEECAPPETLDEEGEPLDVEALKAQTTGRTAPRAIDAQNAFMMYSMLKDVITRGTGRRALELKRPDLAGKTGTTNEQKDAWFSGFNGRITTTAWVGFDSSAALGNLETGARAALPMWIDYMRVALKDTPETELVAPPGIVTVRVDPASGALVGVGQRNAVVESFRERDVPRATTEAKGTGSAETLNSESERLF